MTTHYIAHFEPWQTLDALNIIVAQQEQLLGPLTEISFDSKSTVLTLAYASTPPGNHAVIRPSKDGRPVVPEGWTLVDEGIVFIEGKLVLCAASRPA